MKTSSVLFVIGMSFFWSYFTLFSFSSDMLPGMLPTDASWFFSFASLVTSAVLAVLMFVFRGRGDAIAKRRRVLVGVGMVLYLATLTLPFLLSGFATIRLSAWVFATVSVSYASLMAFFWSRVSCRYSVYELSTLLAESLLVSLVFGVVIGYGIEVLNLPGDDTNFIFLLISGICLIMLKPEDESDGQGAGDAGESREPSMYVIAAIILLCYILGSGVIRSLYSIESERFGISNWWIHCVVGLIAYAALVIFLRKRKRKDADPYPWVVLAAIFIMVLYAIALLYPYRPDICEKIILPTRPLAYVLLWACVLFHARARRLDASLAVICFLLPVTACLDFACNSAYYLRIPVSGMGISVQMLILATALAITFGLVAWLLMTMRNDVASEARYEQSRTSGETVEKGDTLFADIALRFSLSKREEQVMELLYAGNTQKKISELLIVSLNSVQTYMKSLYRKLGVHSRQQLIDLLNERKSVRR